MAAKRPTRPSVRLMLPSPVHRLQSTVHRPPSLSSIHSCHSSPSCAAPSPPSPSVLPSCPCPFPPLPPLPCPPPMRRSLAPLAPLSSGRRRSNRRQHGCRSQDRGPLMALRRCSVSDRNRTEKMRLDTDLAMASNHGQDGGSWRMEVAVV